MLDIGCGPALQLREMARRGYETAGLDISPQMLAYVEKRAAADGIKIETIRADMADFTLKKRADFAFIMMGTIDYIASNRSMLRHLDCVAASLRRGGLYLIENFRIDWSSKGLERTESWTMERDGIRVTATYSVRPKDALTQMLRESLRLDVDDRGKKFVFEETAQTKMIFPQEMLALIELNGRLEFLGWFERGSMKRLRKASPDNIVLLRKK
jgi:SAM-dependent methyltransferase